MSYLGKPGLEFHKQAFHHKAQISLAFVHIITVQITTAHNPKRYIELIIPLGYRRVNSSIAVLLL